MNRIAHSLPTLSFSRRTLPLLRILLSSPLLVLGCSSSPSNGLPADAGKMAVADAQRKPPVHEGGTDTSAASAPLRPGVDDSNAQYMGVPSSDETAYWVAVRNADDAARAT